MRNVKVGMIGFGLAGKVFHEPLINSVPGFEIIKVVSSKEKQVLEILPHAKIVSNAEEIFSDNEIDLVINCSPNTTHYSYTKKALEAGQHVIVEKPFVTSIAEGKELINLAQSRSLILSVFHNRRLDADLLTIKKLIDGNSLGHIKQFESHFDRFRPFVSSEKWREQKGVGNGTLYDLGSHLIDQALYLFGEPNSLIADVGVQKNGGLATDYFHLIFKYSCGMRVILHSTTFGSTYPRFQVLGDKASFVKFGMDVQEAQSRSGLRPTDDKFGVEPSGQHGKIITYQNDRLVEEKVNSLRGQYCEYYRNIYNVITGVDKELIVSASDALRVIELIELAYTSSREGREIKL